MGLSRKISRIGKTKKEKEALKLIKTASNALDKKGIPIPKEGIKSLKMNLPKQVLKAPLTAGKIAGQTAGKIAGQTAGKKSVGSSKSSKYVTEGMVDYVTLLRSRKSGDKLRKEFPHLK